MVLCTIPLNCRLMAEVLKELEQERRSGRTAGRNDRGQYPSAPMAADGNNRKPWPFPALRGSIKKKNKLYVKMHNSYFTQHYIV